MTKEQLTLAFSSDCTKLDRTGTRVIKGTPTEIIDWIAERFCKEENDAGQTFVGVSTGMHDKNGRPIHEGDKVRLYYKGDFVVCSVVYDARNAAFVIKWPDGYTNPYFMNGNNYEVVSE